MPVDMGTLKDKPEIRPLRLAPSGIDEVISTAYTRWGVNFQRKGPKEAAGPCPVACGGGEDRFVLFADGGYWCRQCGSSGWVTEGDGTPLTESELVGMRLSALERKQQETDERLTALEKMARRTGDVERYHANLDGKAVDWWHDVQGVSYQSINDYRLGYCSSCPTAPGCDSYTIPYIQGGKLVNIRHRLTDTSKGKYRPHIAGLGIALFQTDLLNGERDRIILVEGEVKAIVLTQEGLPSVGIMGKTAFEKEWTARFRNTGRVVVALDPDAWDNALRLGKMLAESHPGLVQVASLPAKPDDMMVKMGATREDMETFFKLGRPA